MELSKRDLFLIEQGFKAGDSGYYETSEQWLDDDLGDGMSSIGQYLAHDASLIGSLD